MDYNSVENKSRRQLLRRDSTIHERILWSSLKGRKICNLKFRRQFGVGNYILDFYCPEIKLCVELDGNVHEDVISSSHDHVRNIYLNSNDIYVLRFENSIIYSDFDNVIQAITNTAIRIMNKTLKPATRIVTKYSDIEYPYK